MRTPSVKKLSLVFSDPKKAKAILTSTRSELMQIPVCLALEKGCLHQPTLVQLRMTALNDLESGLHGIEYVRFSNGSVAEYLNTGDMYAATLFRHNTYRVGSIGDLIETQERRGIKAQ